MRLAPDRSAESRTEPPVETELAERLVEIDGEALVTVIGSVEHGLDAPLAFASPL
jgi:hypothetical protein